MEGGQAGRENLRRLNNKQGINVAVTALCKVAAEKR